VRRPYKGNRVKARGAGRVGSKETVTARSLDITHFRVLFGTSPRQGVFESNRLGYIRRTSGRSDGG
jgi:hypothetical protein